MKRGTKPPQATPISANEQWVVYCNSEAFRGQTLVSLQSYSVDDFRVTYLKWRSPTFVRKIINTTSHNHNYDIIMSLCKRLNSDLKISHYSYGTVSSLRLVYYFRLVRRPWNSSSQKKILILPINKTQWSDILFLYFIKTRNLSAVNFCYLFKITGIMTWNI